MEYALAEHLLYLPPLLIAGLIALYRNNILCFWDCNPLGVAVKQFHGQVAVRLSSLLQLARNVALMIRNFPSALVAKISMATDLVVQTLRNTALMILTTIQGILVTILKNLSLTVYQVKEFMRNLFAMISNYTAYLRNTTVTLFQSTPTSSNHLYIGFIVLATLGCLIVLLYHYHKTKKELPVEQPTVSLVEEIQEKKPVRRRTKKLA